MKILDQGMIKAVAVLDDLEMRALTIGLATLLKKPLSKYPPMNDKHWGALSRIFNALDHVYVNQNRSLGIRRIMEEQREGEADRQAEYVGGI